MAKAAGFYVTGRTGPSILPLQLLVVTFLLIRVFADLNAAPVGDEAYYWMWGQHFSWSYFDHPPLHAWLLRAVSAIFGWNQLSIRILTWFTLAGVFAIFWDWSRRLAPDDTPQYFWRAAAIYLASPLFFTMTMVSYNDHLLVFLSLLSVHLLAIFAGRYETGRPHAMRHLYFGMVALGLAVLTKYNGVFVGLGFCAYVLWRKPMRPLLMNPHFYAAGALALALQAPVIYWNLAEGLASYRFHLVDRWGDHFGHPDWLRPALFLMASTLFLSPFLVSPLVKLIGDTSALGFAATARRLAICILAASSGTLAIISIFMGAYFYWNIVAFSAVLPLLVPYIGDRLQFWGHMLFGFVMALLVTINFALMPLGPLLGIRDSGTSVNFGWKEIAEAFQNASAARAPDFLAGTRYSTASQLGFALGRTDVVALSVDHDQYDYWFNASSYGGKNALILTDEADGSPAVNYLREHFDSLGQVADLPITRLGREIYHFRIFFGESYR